MKLLRYLGYLSIPVAFAVHLFLWGKSWEPTATFILSAVGVIPLARLIGIATETLAEVTGPTWGGLLNATFGNACELIIGIVGISRGITDVVKASLTGSILGNLLLVAGGAMVVGGWRRERQQFSRAAAQANAGLLAVAVTAMLFPAIFHLSFQGRDYRLVEHEIRLSVGASIILLFVYGAGLLFTLKTHAHIFSSSPALTDEHPGGIRSLGHHWSVRQAILVLLLCSIIVAGLSELLTGTVSSMASHLKWNPVFVGVVVIAVVGNAAEHSTALFLARRNDMDTAMSIAYQSSLQIALFATPILVLFSAGLSLFSGHAGARMDLVFSPLEVAAVLLSVGIIIIIASNGETNWFEGVLLLSVYAILSIGFFYIPAVAPRGYDSPGEAARHEYAPAMSGGTGHASEGK